MIYLILRLIMAALLTLTGVSTEDELLSLGEVVTERVRDIIENDGSDSQPPHELQGPGS